MPNSKRIKGIQASEDVYNFINVARLYCTFIEEYQSGTTEEFLMQLQRHLLNIYQNGIKLPQIDVSEHADFTEELENDFFKKVVTFIANRLVGNRYYLHLFNPADENDTEIMYGDLLDDIGDIYGDIKRSLLILDIATDLAKENAIWQFKFDFDNHWGDHCINAIYASHYFLKKENR